MRTILHCDLNNFFASVEIHDNPKLAPFPIAVCGSVEERSGIVLAKNYFAKSFGVSTAEPIWQAKQKCPKLIVVPPHYDRYLYFSKLAREVYCKYSYAVESFGIDEAWLDVTHCRRLFGTGMEIAEKIRAEIKEKLGLTVSIGVSFNKVFAKLGSDLKKPDAITEISTDNFKRKVFDLPASDMLWIGKSTSAQLSRFCIHTIGELAETSPDFLKQILGVNGEIIWRNANGLDDSPVVDEQWQPEIKSVGNSTTAIHDLNSEEEVRRVMLYLAAEVSSRLRKHSLEATVIQISVKDNHLISRQFQYTLENSTRSQRIIHETAMKLFNAHCRPSDIRALGVRAAKVISDNSCAQINMLYNYKLAKKLESLESTADKINRRYGNSAVRPASLLVAPYIKGNICCLPRSGNV